MSTKIYNGIKFNSNNLYEILQQLTDIKNKAHQIGIKSLVEQLFFFISRNDLQFTHSFQIISELIKSFNKPTRRILDPSALFSVIVLPHKSGAFYGFYLNDNINAYPKLLFDNNIAKDFHYQNQTDMPDNISEKEWDYRRQVWDELIVHGSTWSENGFELRIITDTICYAISTQIQAAQRKILSRLYRHMWE